MAIRYAHLQFCYEQRASVHAVKYDYPDLLNLRGFYPGVLNGRCFLRC